MKAAASQRFWWPGMDAAIDQKRAQCRHCNEMAPSNHREPLCPSPELDYPWQMVVADYFAMGGNNYLVVADRFTGWIELYKMDRKALTLIKTLRNLFAQMGVLEELATDQAVPQAVGHQLQAVCGSLPAVQWQGRGRCQDCQETAVQQHGEGRHGGHGGGGIGLAPVQEHKLAGCGVLPSTDALWQEAQGHSSLQPR